jgi:type I restriction enzyme R subunit
MTKITENEIEFFAIEILEKQGFEYIYAPSIASNKKIFMRNTL